MLQVRALSPEPFPGRLRTFVSPRGRVSLCQSLLLNERPDQHTQFGFSPCSTTDRIRTSTSIRPDGLWSQHSAYKQDASGAGQVRISVQLAPGQMPQATWVPDITETALYPGFHRDRFWTRLKTLIGPDTRPVRRNETGTNDGSAAAGT